MLKKTIALALIACSLQACETTKAIHVDLECKETVSHYVTFSDEEKASITNSVLDKFELIVETYKSRIKSTCRQIRVHNEEHNR